MKTSKIRVPQSAEDETAEAIAWAAMKYGILRYELKKDIRFDPESTIQLTGDTGPYLQYTHARIQGIMRKSKRAISAKVAVNLDRPEEQALLRRLYRYPEVVETAALAYAPNILTEYLCDLAHAFNAFYNSVSVLQAETEAAKMSRLRLCAAVAQVLRNGLTVLGIKALERM
jgi:arginyl-tRNA synthetase